MKKCLAVIAAVIIFACCCGICSAVDYDFQYDDIGCYLDIEGVNYYFDESTGEFFYIDDFSGEHIYIDIANYLPNDMTDTPAEDYTDSPSAPDAPQDSSAQFTEGSESYKVKVLEVLSDTTEQIDYLSSRVQELSVEVLEGPYKGMIITVTNDISDTLGNGQGSKPAEPGDRLLAYFYTDASGTYGVVTSFYRANTLIWLSVIFLVLLIIIGGLRGIRSVVALVTTCVGCIFIMIPAILAGASPVLAAILLSVFAISVTLVIVYGFTMKTLAASIGALGGIVLSGILVAVSSALMKMTGVVDSEAMSLGLMSGEVMLDLSGILFAVIVISILGGTIDVSISVASALDELRLKAKNISGAELLASGINVSVDVIGASLNTLILSYVGGSLHLLLLIVYYVNSDDIQPALLINDEQLASELLRALCGSIGLLLTGPLTALIASLLMCKGNFGKLTPDCFQTIAAAKRLAAKLRTSAGADSRKPAARSTAKPVRTAQPAVTQAPDDDFDDDFDEYFD